MMNLFHINKVRSIRLAEQLVEEGIVVVAAVGNDENGVIKPPANSLNVIAVGGIDDDNKWMNRQ